MNYLDYKIDHPLVPDSIFYIPNFIESDDERKLIDHIKQAPKPKWQYLSNRSLQVYGGYPNKNGMLAEDLPQVCFFFLLNMFLLKQISIE